MAIVIADVAGFMRKLAAPRAAAPMSVQPTGIWSDKAVSQHPVHHTTYKLASPVVSLMEQWSFLTTLSLT